MADRSPGAGHDYLTGRVVEIVRLPVAMDRPVSPPASIGLAGGGF